MIKREVRVWRVFVAFAALSFLAVAPGCRRFGGVVPEEPKEPPKAPVKK